MSENSAAPQPSGVPEFELVAYYLWSAFGSGAEMPVTLEATAEGRRRYAQIVKDSLPNWSQNQPGAYNCCVTAGKLSAKYAKKDGSADIKVEHFKKGCDETRKIGLRMLGIGVCMRRKKSAAR